jgi:hypothetical protein
VSFSHLKLKVFPCKLINYNFNKIGWKFKAAQSITYIIVMLTIVSNEIRTPINFLFSKISHSSYGHLGLRKQIRKNNKKQNNWLQD